MFMEGFINYKSHNIIHINILIYFQIYFFYFQINIIIF